MIHADWIIPVNPINQVLQHHSLAINQGRILAILPRYAAQEQFQAQEIQNLSGYALIPGLINSHTHAAMTLLRGLVDDLPLTIWLNEHIWPAEQRWVGEEFVRAGTQLALLEMLRGGTTCFNDMYFFPDITAIEAATAGMRACVGIVVVEFPSVWAENPAAYFSKGLAVHDKFAQHPLIRTTFAPHAPYSVSDSSLQRIATLAEELNLQIHIHLHETQEEINNSLNIYNQRPLTRLHNLGLLSPRLMAVHMTQLELDEIRLLEKYGCHVVHCPESNLKLASGISPVAQHLLPANINCALGTDGAASNNDLNLLGEMRTAALLAKGITGDSSALTAATALQMATLNGAKALSLDSEIGSLEIGKAADVVAIDLMQPETQPVYNPISQIVYACSRSQIRHVWIAGRQILRDRIPQTLDIATILQQAQIWQERIQTSDLMDKNP